MKTKKKVEKYEPVGTKPKVGDRTVWVVDGEDDGDVSVVADVSRDGRVFRKEGKGLYTFSHLSFFVSGCRRILKRKKKAKKSAGKKRVVGPKVYKSRVLAFVIDGERAFYCGHNDGDMSSFGWCSGPAEGEGEREYIRTIGGYKRLKGKERLAVLKAKDGNGRTYKDCKAITY